MSTPAQRHLAYKRVAERIANELEYRRKQGWDTGNFYLCQELAEEAGHCADYYSPDCWWGDEDCHSWDAACRRAFAELKADWPEFALFKPKHRKMGEQWFGDTYPSAANTERRLTVLAFCIAMTEQSSSARGREKP